MGGGDIKLMAAGCFWFSLRGQATYLSAALIAGGILAALVLAYRWLRAKGGLKRLGSASIGIPYAVAIAAGAGWTVWHYRLGLLASG
jgi:Flp pilus assembly protein protease CpaA